MRTRHCLTVVLPVALAILLLAANARAATILGYYTFDGNGADSSGFGFDASLHGLTAFAPGQIGQALVLDGAGWAQVAHDPLLEFGTGDFTVALWASFSSHDDEQVLIEKCQGVCSGETLDPLNVRGWRDVEEPPCGWPWRISAVPPG